MAKGNALAKTGKHLPAAAGYAADAGAGYEGTTTSDFSITRLRWLQDLSPETKNKNPRYLEGAKPGMILDPVTGKLYAQLTVVPFHYRRMFVEWVDRDEDGQGGFVAEHQELDPRWERQLRGPYLLGKKLTPDHRDHVVNDTREFGVLFSDEVDRAGLPVGAKPALLAGTGSQLKRFANWLTVMNGKLIDVGQGRRAPLALFANCFDVKLGDQVNRDNQQFYGWEFTDTGVLVPADHELYQRGAALHQQMLAGTLSAPPREREPGGEEASGM